VGAVTSQRVLKVLFYVNILQCFFVVEHFTTNAVSVAIGDNGNRLITGYTTRCPTNLQTGFWKTLIFSMKHTVYIYITLIYNFIVSKNT
jgi:hypothetical protein